eukprot:7972861-Alexandrium_andersonii.AAC.1
MTSSGVAPSRYFFSDARSVLNFFGRSPPSPSSVATSATTHRRCRSFRQRHPHPLLTVHLCQSRALHSRVPPRRTSRSWTRTRPW